MKKGETVESNGAKKQKLEGTNEENESAPPPPYGSQEYWEERYQKNQRFVKSNGEETSDTSDALPFHPWYFSFGELSPLILPIILGGRDRGVNLLGGCRKEEDGDTNGTENNGGNQEAEPATNSAQAVNGKENPQDDIDDSDGGRV